MGAAYNVDSSLNVLSVTADYRLLCAACIVRQYRVIYSFLYEQAHTIHLRLTLSSAIQVPPYNEAVVCRGSGLHSAVPPYPWMRKAATAHRIAQLPVLRRFFTFGHSHLTSRRPSEDQVASLEVKLVDLEISRNVRHCRERDQIRCRASRGTFWTHYALGLW